MLSFNSYNKIEKTQTLKTLKSYRFCEWDSQPRDLLLD